MKNFISPFLPVIFVLVQFCSATSFAVEVVPHHSSNRILFPQHWQVLQDHGQNFFSDKWPEELKQTVVEQFKWKQLSKRGDFQRREAEFWSPGQKEYWFRYPLSIKSDREYSLIFHRHKQLRALYWGGKKLWGQDSEHGNEVIWLTSPHHLPEYDDANYLYALYQIESEPEARILPAEMILGETSNVMMYLLKRNGLELFSYIFSTLLGLVLLLFYFVTNREQKTLFYLAFFSASSGIAHLSFLTLYTLMFPSLRVVSMLLFFIFPVGMLGFLECLRSEVRLTWLKIGHGIYMLVAAVLVIIDQSWLPALVDCMYFLFGIDVLILLKVIFTYLLKEFRDSKIILAGFFSIPAGAVLSTVTSFTFDIDSGVVPWFSLSLIFFFSTLVLMIHRRFQESNQVIRDYTTELEQKNRELGELDRLKDEFLANTSHELRTPLHGIIGIAESLTDLPNLPDQSGKTLWERSGIIIRSARRLNLLINDILDTASLKAQKLQLKTKAIAPDRAAALACEVVFSIARQKSIRLLNQVPEALPPVEADEERLQQILLNLLGNAIKFTTEGEVSIHAERHDDRIVFSVEDTGPGIDPDKQQTVFDLFEKGVTSTNSSGTGLGLAITKSLVKLHGGDLWIDRQRTVGSRFVFTLPISKEQIENVNVDQEISATPYIQPELEDDDLNPMASYDEEDEKDKRKQLILIVDDDPVNLQILGNQLSGREFRLRFANSAKEALEKINEDRPDLILLDVMMPGMNGFELCRIIRKKNNLIDLPILFLTAKTQVNDIVEGFLCGGNDYLPKPFSKEELLVRIRTQFQLLTTKNHLVTLREFSNRIGQLQDTDKLIEVVFESICNNLTVTEAALFQGEQLRKLLTETDENEDNELTDIHQKEQEELLISKENRHFLKTTILANEPFSIILKREKPFTPIDQEFIQNLADQLQKTIRNFHLLVDDPKRLEILSFIASNLENILYIQSEKNYCSVVLEQDQSLPRLQRITLKGIKLYFSDERLVQVHRSYLINPNKMWRFETLPRNRYNLVYENISIPIGKSNQKTINKVFSHLEKL